MSVQEPMDLVKNSLGMKVFIKCRHGRHLIGKLHAYDEH
jgi:small nuclear ribonucleoprotein (snRNP)-like protein